MEALETVKANKERVCPLDCGAQFNIKGGQCVMKTCASGQKFSKRGWRAVGCVSESRNAPLPSRLDWFQTRIGAIRFAITPYNSGITVNYGDNLRNIRAQIHFPSISIVTPLWPALRRER